MAEQSEPFLRRYSSDEEELKSDNTYEQSRQASQWYSKRNLCIHATLILLYTLLSLVTIKWQATSVCKNDIQTRGNTIPIPTIPKPTTFHNLSMTPFAGDKPKEDLDNAWETLLKPMNMRFSEEELRSTNQESVSLPEEGGYLGWFGVFHSLHCVVSSNPVLNVY
ncbi:hypothetical protein K505DRAFT_248952 [Melanomma pulvis-pyrius CBS 109.77]|uniref:Uncharacterized protein n=1 Tax=Melanomma pulvis-pyrius CBS 109.77 TaxID=1314802 RepID=A0A6A6X5N6_9PLEO|nr:hypothetical protein K505DRAFT_248952 [Melanomma pulvis-pyrius CBS 109.77]